MRRLVDAEPEPDGDLDDDHLDGLAPHGGKWSRSTVAGVEGLRCCEHDLRPDEH